MVVAATKTVSMAKSGLNIVAAAKNWKTECTAHGCGSHKNCFGGQKDPAAVKRVPIIPKEVVPAVPEKWSQWIKKPKDG